MKRRNYVAQIRKTKNGYKFIFIPRDFPSNWAFIKVYEDYIEIHPYYPETSKQKQSEDPDLFEEFDKMQRGL